jgi:hypothetical protein
MDCHLQERQLKSRQRTPVLATCGRPYSGVRASDFPIRKPVKGAIVIKVLVLYLPSGGRYPARRVTMDPTGPSG